jgi:flavorubredoxin
MCKEMRVSRRTEVAENIFWLGVNDLETELFEAMWPIPDGISYNSYLITEGRTALVDAVKTPYFPAFCRRLDEHLDGRNLDYLIVNHLEPDHAGPIGLIAERYPGVRIVGNKRTMDLLRRYHAIENGTHLVADGDTLDLEGRKLHFLVTPMVHWPETMMTWDEKDRILFSCDMFGGFGSLAGGIFDDEIQGPSRERGTLRYFTNVFGSVSTMVQKAFGRLAKVDVAVVAPSHGPVWRKDPDLPMNWYERWSRQVTEPCATVVYGSMYQNTKTMAEAVARAMAEGGVGEITLHDVSRVHPSYILADAWKSRALLLGSATYNVHLFPPMQNLVNLFSHKKMKDRLVGIFGSCGWSGGAVKELRSVADENRWTVIDPVIETMGAPFDESLAACAELGRNMAAALKTED